MLSKLVMIIDKRKELPAKYKKYIETNGISVLVTTDFEKGLETLTELEPDLVIISDSLDISLAEATKKIRMLSYASRPCIVAMSKSSELQDKLNVLDAGADDFLSEPIDSDEFKARINAHLRRHYENLISETTNLPDVKFSLKVLKRTIIEGKNWSSLLVKVNNYNEYKDIYGELAADKLLQTYSAIINSTLEDNDFVGQLTNGEFLILTKTVKAERIASFLVYAFDTIVEKFYSEEDAKAGYIILLGDDNAGKRINLISTSIGVISSDFHQHSTVNEILSSLFNTCKLATTNIKSAYNIERAKISGCNSVLEKEYNNNILIIEPDEALNYLLKTTAEMQGYNVNAINDYDKAINFVKKIKPALIILDAGSTEKLEGLDLCKKIKQLPNFENTKIILSTVVHDKKMILNAGADLYMPKPYELLNIFNWVENLIKDYND